MEERKTFLGWVNEHKTELLIAGAATVGAILIIKNRQLINDFIKCEGIPCSMLPSTTSPKAEIIDITNILVPPAPKVTSVQGYLRNLPKGYQPSAFKIAEAANSGVELGPNQTLVSAHPRCYAA